MEYKIKAYRCLCELEVFTINGIEAEKSDFVEKEDRDRENAEPYGCGDMHAEVIEPTEEVLEKYSISREEYYIIAERVAEAVSFGACGWCV